LKYIIHLISIAFFIIFVSGCGSLKEYWSENYALDGMGGKASLPEINDGKIETFGVTHYPDREYEIILPEQREINRIIIYGVNLKSYDILCLNNETKKWVSVASLGGRAGKKNVYYDQYKTLVPKFEHRLKYKTDRIKLVIIRTTSDAVVTTRSPAKNEKILNQRIEYIQLGRERRKIELYDVFRFTDAGVREIEIYSSVPKPETK